MLSGEIEEYMKMGKCFLFHKPFKASDGMNKMTTSVNATPPLLYVIYLLISPQETSSQPWSQQTAHNLSTHDHTALIFRALLIQSIR